MRIVFMGTPEFSVPALAALGQAGHEVIAVYSQPPRPSGRGHKEHPSPVHQKALELGIPVYTPRSLRQPEEQARFAALGADLAVVAAYGLILPQPILDAPRLGCINIHASLLPRWRGAAPIHRAIMAGDAVSGITIMRMEAGLDTGPMLLWQTTRITDATTTGDLHDALADMGAAMLPAVLDGLAAGTLKDVPQPVEGVTYAEKISREEARILWGGSAEAVARHINGLSPVPGAWFEAEGERIKVLLAAPAPEHPSPGNGAPGTVLDDDLTVACGTGAVRLLRLQRAGKGALSTGTFLRGFVLPAGTRLP